MAFVPDARSNPQQRILQLHSRSSLIHPRVFTCVLRMGKGFNSAKNKQAELAKKMALAKKQQNVVEGSSSSKADQEPVLGDQEKPSMTDEQRKLEEDRARFAQLLRESKVVNPNPYESDRDGEDSIRVQSPRPMPKVAARVGELRARKSKARAKDMNRRKKETSKNEAVKEEDEDKPLQEGDVARRGDFETLISRESSAPLGPIDAARLVPWVPPFVADYMVIVADPRAQSGDLRKTIQYLTSNTSPDILERVIAISSDGVVETTSWLNRSKVDTPIKIFSDRNWEWMRRYSAVVSDGRWAMSLLVIDSSGVLRKVLTNVDPSKSSQLVNDAVKSIER